MKPALRLASLFHAVSANFFLQTYLAQVVISNNTPLLDSDFNADDTDMHAYRTMLASLSNTMRIHSGYIKYASCGISHAKSSSTLGDRIQVFLQLNSDYIDWYSRVDHENWISENRT